MSSNVSSVIALCLLARIAASLGSDPLSVHRSERRIPENVLQVKDHTTTADPLYENADDVFAIPIDDFRDYWYGRRLRKRSLLSIDEDDNDIAKRSQYQPWGGKRVNLPNIFSIPTRFNPNGGKRTVRYPKDSEASRKRTPKSFDMWAGKRSGPPNGKSFVIWGGKKRADAFTTWGGKRADGFTTWGGKRSELFE